MEEKAKNLKFENFNPELMIIKLQEIINYIRKLKYQEIAISGSFAQEVSSR